MRRLSYAYVALAALSSSVIAIACGKNTRASFDEIEGGPAGSSGGFTPEGGTTDLPQCADDNKDVFVIAEDRTFYSFHPPTLTFSNRGILDCPTGGALPTSMAVDRRGIAWVRYSDGTVWKVDTKDLSCQPTKFEPQTQAFVKFGMGFATETKGGSTEVLYLSDSNGAGLAKLDTSTLGLAFIGAATGDLAGTPCELTGTGDGKLYGFFTSSPAHVAELSKATGDVIKDYPLTNVYAGTAWAFSFYGGQFFIYTSPDGGGLPRNGGGSDVTKFDPVTGSIDVVKSKIGFKIVGAGVSTCAPTTNVN